LRTTPLQRRCALLACGLALGTTAGTGAASAQTGDAGSRLEPRMLYAITAQNALVRFDSRNPQRIRSRRSISGLDAGTTLKGIDFRPRTGDLYGVGSDNVVYRIEPNTAIAVAEGPAFTPGLNGRVFGFDINPFVDKIRVVSDAGQNLRLNPDEGTLLMADGNINPGTPQIVGSAYINSGFSENLAPSTMLFAVDAASDQIFLQNPPNNGTLANARPLGVDVQADTGFDIAGDDNVGYLVTRSGRGSRLYAVDPMTGGTRRLGTVGNGRLVLTGLAAWQDAANNPPRATPAPSPTPTPTPSPAPSPAPTPSPTPTPSPSPAPTPSPPGSGSSFASLDRPARTTVARFLSRGIRVTGTCASGRRGTVQLTVSRKTARRIGLRGTTLASRSVRCANGLVARLRAAARAKSALRRARGPVATTLRVRLGSAADSLQLRLRR
jgi:hypothetical protein